MMDLSIYRLFLEGWTVDSVRLHRTRIDELPNTGKI